MQSKYGFQLIVNLFNNFLRKSKIVIFIKIYLFHIVAFSLVHLSSSPCYRFHGLSTEDSSTMKAQKIVHDNCCKNNDHNNASYKSLRNNEKTHFIHNFMQFKFVHRKQDTYRYRLQPHTYDNYSKKPQLLLCLPFFCS